MAGNLRIIFTQTKEERHSRKRRPRHRGREGGRERERGVSLFFSAARRLGPPDGPPLARPDRRAPGPRRPRTPRSRLRRGRHPRLDLRGHRHERLLDVGAALGRGLQKGDAGLVGKGLGRRGVDDLLRLLLFIYFLGGGRGS